MLASMSVVSRAETVEGARATVWAEHEIAERAATTVVRLNRMSAFVRSKLKPFELFIAILLHAA